MVTKLSLLDKRILNRLQKDIPFETKPWAVMAGELDIKEDVFLERVDFLTRQGFVRRISAVFNPRKIGCASTLVALKISPEDIDKVAEKINLYPEVTHNYRRENEYNLWFTLVAESKKRIAGILRGLKKDKRIKGMLNLETVRLFKIDVNFKV